MRAEAGSGVRLALLVLASLTLLGCARGCPSSRPPIHVNPSMDSQPRYDPQSESEFFYDGATMRTPVPGTVARGALREDEPFFSGKGNDGQFLAAAPLSAGQALARGEQRYAIYCQPCHGARGNGRGVLTERAGVPVPDFHEERLRAMSDGEIFDTITNGKGLMPGYAYPIPAADRWAIIVHMRELQQRAATAAAALAASR